MDGKTVKIGVTEQGDAAIDLSWADKMGSVDGAVLITKRPNGRFMDAVMKHKDKAIVHITCTGYGGTSLEPYVPEWEPTAKQAEKLIARGFGPAQIVWRIDPVIPTERGIKLFKRVCRHRPEGISRVRVSLIDMYPHAMDRFKAKGLPDPYKGGCAPPAHMSKAMDAAIAELRAEDPALRICACAEPQLKNAVQEGCVSEYDLELLGITAAAGPAPAPQRKGCLCIAGKTELLEKRKRQCGHRCLYCYWKRDYENA